MDQVAGEFDAALKLSVRVIRATFQCAALHWVQENIGEFGGDANRVTLVGFGAGAACVHFLMTSPAVMNGKANCLTGRSSPDAH